MPPESVLRWAGLIRGAAALRGLDPALVASVVEQESAGDERAVRREPKYRWFYRQGGVIVPPPGWTVDAERAQQATSWGLMQVMGAVLREQGCALADLYDILDDPAAQLAAGCRHLAGQVRRWGDVEDAVSAYNAGTPSLRGSRQWRRYVVPVMSRVAGYAEALGRSG